MAVMVVAMGVRLADRHEEFSLSRVAARCQTEDRPQGVF